MTLIMKGGEPFFFEGGPRGLLMVHGFTASPQEMRWMGTSLHERGYTVLGVRLAGHATSLADLARVRWQDWFHSVEDGYHQLSSRCSDVIPIGISLGGALSLMLASMHPVKAFIGLSTPYRLDLPPTRLLRAASLFRPYKPKDPGGWNRKEAAAARIHYDAYPLRSIAEITLLLDHLRPKLPEIHCPVLLMHSRRDDFVTPDNMENLHNDIGSRNKVRKYFDRSNHILTCDIDREGVLAETAAYLANLK